MPFLLFVYISDYVKPETSYGQDETSEPTFVIGTAARRMTAQPLNFPFDRPLHQYQVEKLTNFYTHNILIHHKPTPEIYVPQ